MAPPAAVQAHYSSSTHSLDVTHAVTSSGEGQKAALDALHQAILATQADLNTYLTERKLEEDQANGVNGVNGTAQKRKAGDEDEEIEEDGDVEGDEEEE